MHLVIMQGNATLIKYGFFKKSSDGKREKAA
jgi:hypothetical protein